MNYKTIGFHTVERTDDVDKTERDVPFISTRPYTFLSKGYYFWEDDIDEAHDYGIKNYGEHNYTIFQFDLNLENMYDLVVSAKHRNLYSDYEDVIRQYYPVWKNKEIPTGILITLLRKRNEIEKGGIFEYDSVRGEVVDTSNVSKRKYNDKRHEKMYLRKNIMICLFKKSKLHLQNKETIYPVDSYI